MTIAEKIHNAFIVPAELKYDQIKDRSTVTTARDYKNITAWLLRNSTNTYNIV